MATTTELPSPHEARKYRSVQEMMQDRSNQIKADDLAVRLTLLKKKETEQRQETEHTQKMVQELALRREQHNRRVREKEEELRKVRAIYNIGSVQKQVHPKSPVERMLSDESEKIQQPVPPAGIRVSSTFSGIQSPTRGGTMQSALQQQGLPTSPQQRLLSNSQQASQVSSPQSLRKSPQQDVQSPGRESPRKSPRYPTGDMVSAAHAQGAMVNRGAVHTGPKSRVGAYGPDGDRLWMTPRIMPTNIIRREAAKAAAKGLLIPAPLSQLEPKDLVHHLSKKEKELQDRLEAAKIAQSHADRDLAEGFKSLAAVQISARRAIREGNY